VDVRVDGAFGQGQLRLARMTIGRQAIADFLGDGHFLRLRGLEHFLMSLKSSISSTANRATTRVAPKGRTPAYSAQDQRDPFIPLP